MTPAVRVAVIGVFGVGLLGSGLWAWKRARAGGVPAARVCGDRAAPSDGAWPNEPQGLTVLSDYGFGDTLPPTAVGDPAGVTGWQVWRNDEGRGMRVMDHTAPLSAPYAVQFTYPVGFPSGLDPAMLECRFAGGIRELYWGFWWKPSNPFQSDGSGVNKIAFLWTPTKQNNSTDLLYVDLSPNPWRIRAMNDLIAGRGPTAGERLEPNVDTTTIALGAWHRIEIYAKYSTASKANGVLRWWVDGTLNGDYTDLRMVQDGGFDHVQFAPTYGGNTGDTKKQDDFYRLDHVRLSRGTESPP
jgi:hypothetical protein